MSADSSDSAGSGALNVAEAVDAIRRGEIVAFPTESSHGLAVDAWNALAIERMFALKGREPGKPPPVLVEGEEMIASLVTEIPARARQLMAKFWPGPLTLVLPAHDNVPATLVHEGRIGIRQSPHPIASALAQAGPITATSANLAGQPPAFDAQAVREIFGDRVRIAAGDSGRAVPSTVVRVKSNGDLEVLRVGAIAPTLL